VTGAGPPIVLVHGIGVSGRYLVPTARALTEWRTVYVPDLPGYGRSEAPRRALGVPELADALRMVVAELGLGAPAFLGNSLGCQILVELAARATSTTGPLVLVGPTLDPRRRSFLEGAVALLRDWLREPELTPVAVADYVRFGPVRFLQTARSLLADRPEDKLPRVDVPVLVVRGERDGFITREWAEEVAALAPHGRFVSVPGVAHAVNYTAPGELARLTLEFLDEVE
jgi:pimeloyl-ACP methyl ester carboxylesterase